MWDMGRPQVMGKLIGPPWGPAMGGACTMRAVGLSGCLEGRMACMAGGIALPLLLLLLLLLLATQELMYLLMAWRLSFLQLL